jgi:hypothetical protein
MLTCMRYPQLAFGTLIAAITIVACGGGSSGGGTTVTAPTTTQLTVADAAPSIGEELAITIDAALRAGTASSPPPGTIAAIWRFFVPTLTAQSNFVANCNRGGNINIRYTGFRPVVLVNTPIEVSNCGMRGRNASFSGTLTSNGHWTATAAGPVGVSGNVTSSTITGGTPIAIDAAVTNTTFNGRVGGITVGAPDTNPPPNPNSCPATLSQTAITVPQGGGAYSVTITVGSTCAWSVTTAPSWVTFSNAGGRGNGTISFTVSASDGNQRTGGITVNNMNITLNQLATATASGPDAAVGQWSGAVFASNPCSQGSPVGRYNWTGRLSRSGNTFTFVWHDAYFGFDMTRTFPVGQSFSFVINDQYDTFTLTGTFASDYQSLTGTLNGVIDCVVARPTVTGNWNGTRSGP